jgi:hypothetical protein
MRKPEQLRRLLLRAVPGLADAPERLALFVDEGRIAARAGVTLSFEYRYTANVVIQDYAGDRDAVIVPLLAWIAQAEPELLARPDAQPFTFEAELLDGDAVDLSIKLDLTERVAVTPGADGGYEVRHLDDLPADPDFYDGICGVVLRQLHLHDVPADITTTVPE